MDDRRYKILLIEDNKLDQMAFERLVRQENLPYEMAIAGSVSEAEKQLSSQDFDAAIIDYFLGDGTAFDVMELITDVPMILATGAGDEEIAVRAMKAGVSDYLIKDVDRNYLKVLPEIIKNVIHRNKIEHELKEYHEKLESLVEERTRQFVEEKELLSVTLSSMGDAVIAVDADRKIMLFNKVAEQLTGRKFSEIEGTAAYGVIQIIDEETNKPTKNLIDKVFTSNNVESTTGRKALIVADGSVRPISATAAPIYSENGDMIGVVMVFRDMSHERQIDQMKDEFISLVSHELRTPLTSIKAYTETILSNPNIDAQDRNNFLFIIDEESNRLADLVDDILEISRLDDKPSAGSPKPVDVAGVINYVSSALRPLADKKNITLKTEIGEKNTQFLGDEGNIRSIVTNLVNNAIKYTPDNGQVSVNIEYSDKELAIRVTDTGIGIPKEEIGKIFSRFYRINHANKKIKGTGLGLAVVKRIVTSYNGRIEVESRPNQGTTFTIFLPLNSSEPETGQHSGSVNFSDSEEVQCR